MFLQEGTEDISIPLEHINYEYLHNLYMKNYIYLHAKHPEASDLDCMAFSSGVLTEDVLEKYLTRAIMNSDFKSVCDIHNAYMQVADDYLETSDKLEALLVNESFLARKLLNASLHYAAAFSKRTTYTIQCLIKYGDGEDIKLKELLEKDYELAGIYAIEKKLEKEFEELLSHMWNKHNAH